MITSKGKNNYKDNTYSYWEWSAPILQTHAEVISKIKELNLQNRVIKNVYAVGHGYNWLDDDIEEQVEIAIERMRASKDSISVDNILLDRFAEIDEPVLIEFEDGDILCIDYSEGSSVRIDMNNIPKDINCNINYKNFHADILFENIIGSKLVDIEVTTSLKCDAFTGSYGMDIDEQDSYICKLSLLCENRKSRDTERLEFTSFYDYGHVRLTDSEGQMLKIPYSDVKRMLEGFD